MLHRETHFDPLRRLKINNSIFLRKNCSCTFTLQNFLVYFQPNLLCEFYSLSNIVFGDQLIIFASKLHSLRKNKQVFLITHQKIVRYKMPHNFQTCHTFITSRAEFQPYGNHIIPNFCVRWGFVFHPSSLLLQVWYILGICVFRGRCNYW